MPHALLSSVVLDETVRALCRRPYPNHPKGCPNFGKRAACPPTAPRFRKRFCTGEVWAIWNAFDFGTHCARMRERHPEWSRRQVECCRYWQGTARKQLEVEIRQFNFAQAHLGVFEKHPPFSVMRCPEAMGVNITATMRALGVSLEWPPRTWAFQVALAARGNL